MTPRQRQAARNVLLSKATRRVIKALAKLDPVDAKYEASLIALLFTEEDHRPVTARKGEIKCS